MTETDEPTTTLRAPGRVFVAYRDALGVLRRTHRNYEFEDDVNKEAATQLRHELGEATDGFATGTDHEVELTETEFNLLWSGITDMLFDSAGNVRERAHQGADYLTRAETTPDDGSKLPGGADVWELKELKD